MSRKVIVNGESICYLPPVDASEINYTSGGVTTTVEQALDSKVSKSGDTMTGNLTIDTGNASTVEMARIILGNNKEASTAGKSYGSVMLYGAGGYFNNLVSNDNLTGSRTVQLPNANGTIALRSDLGVCDTLLDEKNIPTTFTSYNCNWNLYYFILLESTFYGNARDQILVPTSYFSGTSDGRRPTINDSGANRSYEVYQNGNDKVYIRSNSTSDIYGILIYGIMKK